MNELVCQISSDGIITCNEIIFYNDNYYKLIKFIDNYQTVVMRSDYAWDSRLICPIVAHISIHKACKHNLIGIIKLLLLFNSNIEFSIIQE